MTKRGRGVLGFLLLWTLCAACASGGTASAEDPVLDPKTANEKVDIGNLHNGRNPFMSPLPHKKEKPPAETISQEPHEKTSGPKSSANQQVKDTTPKEAPLPELVVTGLVWNSDRPQAIINGTVVSEGDVMSNIKIESIKKTGIEIIYLGKKILIKP